MLSNHKSLSRRFSVLIPGLFALVTLVLLVHHALWRDEFNPWLIVRDSPSWSLLWQNVRYEGHPILWYVCLSGLHALTQNFFGMQLFHWGVGFAAILLIWKYSPFRPLEKTLITFGYYPFYEYLIISRNYVFGMFFSYLFCTLFPTRKSRYWPLALILGLMANSHAYALLIGAVLAFVLGVEFLCDRAHRQTYLSKSPPWDLGLSLILMIGLFALAAYCISPPGDSYLHGGRTVFLSFDLHRFLVAIGKISSAYLFLIPNSSRWLDLILTDALILGILAVINLKLLRQPLVLLFFNLSTITMAMMMFYLKDLSSPRHTGGLYTILITSLWLANYYPETAANIRNRVKLPWPIMGMANRLFRPLLIFILVIHIGAGIAAIVERELARPYSASRATTQFILDQGLQDEFIVASRDAQMAPIAGYLQRPLYYPERQELGSFTLFREGRHEVEHDQVLQQATAILQNPEIARSRVLLILHQALEPTTVTATSQSLAIEPINQFADAYTEKYFLYWLSLADNA